MGYGTKDTRRMGMDEEQRTGERMNERMGMTENDDIEMRKNSRTRMGNSTMRMNRNVSEEERSRTAEDIYTAISERMCKALAFHEQLADYFCFLGLQGFKRMLEYQYMKECAEKRKVHHHYIDIHKRVIPVKQVTTPVFIPKEFSRYTTLEMDDSVIPKFVRSALKEWHDWEEETKDIFEEQCTVAKSMDMIADEEYIKELVLDVTKEIKKVARIIEKLNGTGYDVTMIHGVQDKYHEKYKDKYNERFTNKYSRRRGIRSEYEHEEEPYRTRRIGY